MTIDKSLYEAPDAKKKKNYIISIGVCSRRSRHGITDIVILAGLLKFFSKQITLYFEKVFFLNYFFQLTLRY